MKPKPLASLNHFTIPLFMLTLHCYRQVNCRRGAWAVSRVRLNVGRFSFDIVFTKVRTDESADQTAFKNRSRDG